MSFYHRFGTFHETVTVDGTSFSFEEYKSLPKDLREVLREEAIALCVQANQRQSMEWRNLSTSVDVDFRTKVRELHKLSKFQKRYRGRAEDMRYEESLLRDARDRKLRELQASLSPIQGNTYPSAVHNIFSVWEERVETPWEKFERMVNHFDWYYSYSDDHSVWSAGNSRHKQIMELVEQLGPPARKIYNQKCPWLNEDDTQKKEAI